QQVCRYMHDPREAHFSALKRILRYVPGTLDHGNLLSWSSKRQSTLSQSSTEAEYRSVANAVVETCWLRNLLRELHTHLSSATLVAGGQMSTRDKSGLGYGDQVHNCILSYENEVFQSVFDSRSGDVEDSPVHDRFANVEGMHAVPPPMTENYIPSGPDRENSNSYLRDILGDILGKDMYYPLTLTKASQILNLGPTHLIKDCDFHEKRMAKQVELNKKKGKGTGQGENRPVWNNVQRLNHQNKFVPTAVLTRTGRIPVNTARQNLSSQAATRKVNTARPIVNKIRPRNNFYKSHSPIRRPFNRTTAPRTNFSNQKVNTAKVKAVSAVGGKRETAVKPSAGCNWRPKRHYWNKFSKYNGGSNSRKCDNPQRALKNKGIVDSGCSRHMTGNKAYLAEYQDF
ncbi:ribonuclease H-like domain-containing protein, partial [Tanacetum coccineum]